MVVAGDLDSSALKTKADCLTTSEFVFSTKQHEKKLMKATAIKITCNCAVTSCTSFCYVCICNCLLTIFTASSAIIMLWYSGVTNELTVLIQTVLELVHITWLSLCYGSHYWTIKTAVERAVLSKEKTDSTQNQSEVTNIQVKLWEVLQSFKMFTYSDMLIMHNKTHIRTDTQGCISPRQFYYKMTPPSTVSAKCTLV